MEKDVDIPFSRTFIPVVSLTMLLDKIVFLSDEFVLIKPAFYDFKLQRIHSWFYKKKRELKELKSTDSNLENKNKFKFVSDVLNSCQLLDMTGSQVNLSGIKPKNNGDQPVKEILFGFRFKTRNPKTQLNSNSKQTVREKSNYDVRNISEKNPIKKSHSNKISLVGTPVDKKQIETINSELKRDCSGFMEHEIESRELETHPDISLLNIIHEIQMGETNSTLKEKDVVLSKIISNLLGTPKLRANIANQNIVSGSTVSPILHLTIKRNDNLFSDAPRFKDLMKPELQKSSNETGKFLMTKMKKFPKIENRPNLSKNGSKPLLANNVQQSWKHLWSNKMEDKTLLPKQNSAKFCFVKNKPVNNLSSSEKTLISKNSSVKQLEGGWSKINSDKRVPSLLVGDNFNKKNKLLLSLKLENQKQANGWKLTKKIDCKNEKLESKLESIETTKTEKPEIGSRITDTIQKFQVSKTEKDKNFFENSKGKIISRNLELGKTEFLVSRIQPTLIFEKTCSLKNFKNLGCNQLVNSNTQNTKFKNLVVEKIDLGINDSKKPKLMFLQLKNKEETIKNIESLTTNKKFTFNVFCAADKKKQTESRE